MAIRLCPTNANPLLSTVAYIHSASSMATPNIKMDPNTGFCSETKTFQSLKPSIPLPPPSQPLSVTQHILNLLLSSTSTSTYLSETPFLIHHVTGHRITYSQFLHHIKSLAFSLKTHHSLSKGHVAYILCPVSVHVPALYVSLLSIGVIISTGNPHDSTFEITHQIHLSKPTIVFASSQTYHKLPQHLHLPTVLIDSSEFSSLLNYELSCDFDIMSSSVVNQSDGAAIFYSSGTTGRVKGVLNTHRNLIARTAAYASTFPAEKGDQHRSSVSLLMGSLFNSYDISFTFKAAANGETLVITEANDLETVLRAVQTYKPNSFSARPSFILQMVKSEINNYDLSSVKYVITCGSSLGKEVALSFTQKFPSLGILNAYGLSEGGPIAATMSFKEMNSIYSVGRLVENVEAKVVDPSTGDLMSPGKRGELWLRSPFVMKGYIGDENSTSQVLDSDGWLKTGDLCVFDSDGYLFIVDRLKEIFKCYGLQVSPAELEHLLVSHPDIADSVVVPYPDEEAGHIPVAFVVRKPGSTVTESEVLDFMSKRVSQLKTVRRVNFIDLIPKNTNGKTSRRELINAVTPSSS